MRPKKYFIFLTLCSVGLLIVFTYYDLSSLLRVSYGDDISSAINVDHSLHDEDAFPSDVLHTFPTYYENSSTFETRLKSRIAKSLTNEGRSSRWLYLKPFNTLYGELGLRWSTDPVTQRRAMDVIRSGFGLHPLSTEKGRDGWVENGLEYRPWTKPASLPAKEKKFPTPFNPEYDTYIPFKEKDFFQTEKYDNDFYKKKKIILWHTPPKYIRHNLKPYPMRVCPEFPCYETTDLAFMNQSSAMVFAAQMVPPSPPPKRPGQVFVLHNHEPPYENTFQPHIWEDGFKQKSWKKVFNWTMTYRLDSDIVVPYGLVRKRPKPVTGRNYKEIVKKKTKIAAWMVSNCKTASERERYVEELKKYVQVDVFGSCGNIKCPRAIDEECGRIMETNYKFYLAFESAICPDYITEKFFRALATNVIVVARGDDQYFSHIPSEIFLNTADFPSPRALAGRMLHLHRHEDEYIAMLREKDKYMALMEANPIRRDDGAIRFMSYRYELVGVCQLCQRLWNVNNYRKQIDDIHEWFDRKICRKKNDFIRHR